MRIRQEQAFCDSEAAFPYKVKVLWSGILTTLGGGIAHTSSLKKPGFSDPLYQKKSSMDKYVCADLAHILSGQWRVQLPASTAGF